ncbi:MAG: 1-(5-phosphoribosyl)-5-[(5-phosphoribosylamino) methylideneamino]imidazole-4-carboxamide isomerase [Candidatus Limnocylindrales bacterium]
MPQRASSTFELLPAIDLRAGRVVRLRQGDFDREQVYAERPVDVARSFAAAGATWIHVVDLDGARAGAPRQTAALMGILAGLPRTGPRLQVAGGLRTEEAVAEVQAPGAKRVVIGTAALRDPSFAAALIERHGPERVALALDVRDGVAVGDGWVGDASGVSIGRALVALTAAGTTTFAVTAIERDGLLDGPDLELLGACVGATDAAIIASGGIRSIADLEAVRAIGCRGAIIGRALYEGTLDLAAAISSLALPSAD